MDKEGIWRTIMGRRVFIPEGMDVKEAAVASGKFNKIPKKGKIPDYIKYDNINIAPFLVTSYVKSTNPADENLKVESQKPFTKQNEAAAFAQQIFKRKKYRLVTICTPKKCIESLEK